MTTRSALSLAWLFLWVGATGLNAAEPGAGSEPRVYTYREVDGQALRAYLFSPPAKPADTKANAILLFHGGGWSVGSPEWTFGDARRFADAGLVAIAIQYRLSEGSVTPIDAVKDACAAFEWARSRSEELGITKRIAGYGVSAGGHLVASTVTVGCGSEAQGERPYPDALLLWSPALDVSRDTWFLKKLQGRATAAEYSPVEHVRASTPPTSIVHGEQDTLTPISGARAYCERLIKAGGQCELHVYKGVGHLLTRNLANQEDDFDPDPEARAAGTAEQLKFLEKQGLIRHKE